MEELHKAYERALETSRQQGNIHEYSPEEERRSKPRIRLAADTEDGRFKTPDYVLDVSASGACICYRESARKGDILRVYFGGEKSAHMIVVDCRFAGFDDGNMVTHYRLNCAINDETEGRQLVVHLIEQGAEGLRYERT